MSNPFEILIVGFLAGIFSTFLAKLAINQIKQNE